MPFQILPCTPADGITIANLQVPSTPSRFQLLQIGTASLTAMRQSLQQGFPQAITRNLAMKTPTDAFLKVITDDGKMITWARWELPLPEDQKEHGSGGISMKMPRGMNRAFIMRATNALVEMREQVLGGRRCYGG